MISYESFREVLLHYGQEGNQFSQTDGAVSDLDKWIPDPDAGGWVFSAEVVLRIR